jgi:hypothetical protein
MAKFQPGNKGGPGRKKGSRNKLSTAVIEAMLQVFEEAPITKDKPETKGIAALRALFLTDVNAFAKLYASVVPREHWFDNLSEMSNEELDRVIKELGNAAEGELRPYVVAPPATAHAN